VTIVDGATVRGRREVAADVCVVGTGPGGAVVAAVLAERGLRVAMVEEGDRVATAQYTARPRDMSRVLYRDAGQVATVGNVPIVLPLGKGVGGTAAINSGTCFRTPEAVLRSWRERFGLEGLGPNDLAPCFRRVEREIGVAPVTPELAGRNAAVVRRGAERLGWSVGYLHRNARGCVGSGVCAWGCPTAAKQHPGLTYVPRAWEAGATTYTGCRAEDVEVEHGRARAVLARTKGGGRLRVRAEQVVVAAGAIGTPLLLSRARLAGASGQLGRNLSIHPATAVKALMDEDVDMFDGVPQSLYVDEFASDGIMLEGAAGPPDYAAGSFGTWGDEHRETMLRYRQVSQFGLMVSDVSRGTVRRRLGLTVLRYDLVAQDVERIRRGLLRLAELYWAAGARRVFLPVAGLGALDTPDLAPLRERRLRAADLTLMAFHPLGTARAAARAEDGVVDGDLALHGVRGVHVADGSVVPSALGVNPQLTIMALATRLGFSLLGEPVPDEPERPTIPRAAHAYAPA
jgi:choline dehydrogenase-like flavoprotein